jgi:hypothetical protein
MTFIIEWDVEVWNYKCDHIYLYFLSMRSNGSLRTWNTDFKNWTNGSLACGKTKTSSMSNHVQDHAVSVKKAVASVTVSTSSGATESSDELPPRNVGSEPQLVSRMILKNSKPTLAIKDMRINFFI